VPFVGRTLNDIRLKQTEPLPTEQLKVGDVPARILALLKSMLAPDPKDRPRSARELLSAVHRCYTKFSTEARLRRRRFALATASAVLVIAAIAIGAWLYSTPNSPASSNGRSRFAVRKSKRRQGERLLGRGDTGRNPDPIIEVGT